MVIARCRWQIWRVGRNNPGHNKWKSKNRPKPKQADSEKWRRGDKEMKKKPKNESKTPDNVMASMCHSGQSLQTT